MLVLLKLLTSILLCDYTVGLRYALPYLQSGSSIGSNSLHDMGLKGAGETVGVIDTGIDYLHCAFNDDDKIIKTNGKVVDHKKLSYYNNRYQDLHHNDTKENCHGSSMAGAAAGGYCGSGLTLNPGGSRSPPIEQSDYYGMAPLSKIAVFGTSKNQAFDLPVNLHHYLAEMYDVGTRSFVMAFCGGDPMKLVSQMNLFSYKNPDAILVGAAGNNAIKLCGNSSRESLSCSYSSVCHPHIAKNTLTVGGIQAIRETREVIGYPSQYIKVQCGDDEAERIVAVRAQFASNPIVNIVRNSEISIHSGGVQGCKKLGMLMKIKNPTSVSIARRGICTFTEKVLNTEPTTNLVIIVNDNNRIDGPMECLDSDVKVYKPSVLISKNKGENIINKLLKGEHCIVSGPFMSEDEQFDEYWSPQNLLTMSGRGSREKTKNNLRTKPDVVAPGEFILLPKANTTNGLVPHTGSSPATALIAGAALLIREAFLKRKLTVMSTDTTLKYISSAMVRGSLVHCATKLRGFVDLTGEGDWKKLSSKPTVDPFQGYGHPVLKNLFQNVLFYQSSEKPRVETNLCFQPLEIKQNSEAALTISWNDPYPVSIIQDVNVYIRMIVGDELNSKTHDFFNDRVASLEKISFQLPASFGVNSVLRITISQSKPRVKNIKDSFPSVLPFSIIFSNNGASWSSEFSDHNSCQLLSPVLYTSPTQSKTVNTREHRYPSAWGWFALVPIIAVAYFLGNKKVVDKKNT